MRIRWWWWVLALVPAAAGVVSVAFGAGDLRSSGLMAGVSVSLGLVAVLLLLRAPWRRRDGAARWFSVVPPLLLGLVSLLGLSEGLPEFFQARGLFLDVEAVGPVAVVEDEGTLLVVGNGTEGGFAWTSDDGSDWTSISADVFAELEVADAAVYGSSIVVVGQSAEAEAVVLVTEDGAAFEESGRFTNSEYGTIPQAAAGFADGLVVISDIYGNDIEFHTSSDGRSWAAAHPSPVFDDGESARDIVCSDQVCVGVGFVDATYRQDLDTNTGVAWVSTSGDNYQSVDFDFNTESLDAIAWNPSGFLIVANSPNGRGLAWHSTDSTNWNPISGPFTEMTVDGVQAIDTTYMVFGRSPTAGTLVVWTSRNLTDWEEAVVATSQPEGSQIRSIANTQTGLVAVGIDGGTFDILIWNSADGTDWQLTTLAPR